MNKASRKVNTFRKSELPSVTQLKTEATVLFFAPFIDIAIERSVFQLK